MAAGESAVNIFGFMRASSLDIHERVAGQQHLAKVGPGACLGVALAGIVLALGLDMRRQLRLGFADKNGGTLKRQGGIALVKLVLHPLLTWGLLALCGVSGVWLAVCVIMSGTATAIGCWVVADIYKTVPEESALSVVLTNVFSLLTLPAFAYAFKALQMI